MATPGPAHPRLPGPPLPADRTQTGLAERLATLLAESHGAEGGARVEDTAPETYAIAPAMRNFLELLVEVQQPRSVLEFGAGASSIVLARALARRGGGRLTSVEQRPEWCAEAWAAVAAVREVDARLVHSTPRLRIAWDGVSYVYRTAAPILRERGPYDLVLIDAPQWYYGRDGSLHLAHPHLRAGALVVLDDAGRKGERWTLSRWLRTYPGLRLVLYEPGFAGRGLAVLHHDGDPRRRLSLLSIWTSAYHARHNARTRRRKNLHA
jgi:predicted O-methyltransferase YrrM